MAPMSAAERKAFLDKARAKKVGKTKDLVQSDPAWVIRCKSKRKNEVSPQERKDRKRRAK